MSKLRKASATKNNSYFWSKEWVEESLWIRPMVWWGKTLASLGLRVLTIYFACDIIGLVPDQFFSTSFLPVIRQMAKGLRLDIWLSTLVCQKMEIKHYKGIGHMTEHFRVCQKMEMKYLENLKVWIRGLDALTQKTRFVSDRYGSITSI